MGIKALYGCRLRLGNAVESGAQAQTQGGTNFMSTWFHNYQTKIVVCRQCGKEFEVHVESDSTLCVDCLSALAKKIMQNHSL